MIKLKPLLENSFIPRTPINLSYLDDEGSSLEIITSLNTKNFLQDIKISFNCTAKVNITALYFPEFNYNNYEIIESGNECGLYQIISPLDEKIKLFDPMGNLNLKKFLVYGYDSYAEILCSSFEITKF